KPPYGFSISILGLLYIPSSVGYALASVVGGRWSDAIMAREAKRANRIDEQDSLICHPEDRMRENALLGALLYPTALIWYGWTVEHGVHWLVPVSPPFYCRVSRFFFFIAMESSRLTKVADDCGFLLRIWLNDHFQYVHNDADRVYAKKIIYRGCRQQLHAKYILMCWRCGGCSSYPQHWEWLGLHYRGF